MTLILYFCLLMGNIYRLENVVVGYGRKRDESVAVAGINASLEPGELVCLIGRNGSGKSTLLRTLAALQPALAGEILLEGKPLSHYSCKELSRRVSVVLTDSVTERFITVREMVSLGRYPYTGFLGRLSDKDRQCVDEALELMNISHLSSRFFSELSDGERQKTLLAKVIAQQAVAILLDEPMSFLDYPNKILLMEKLWQIVKKRNVAVLMSVHDLDVAFRMAQKFWVLTSSNELFSGNREEVLASGLLDTFRFDM